MRRGADLPGRQDGFVELEPVGESDRDEVVALHAEVRVGAGEAVGALLEGAAAEGDSLMGQRRSVWVGLGQSCERNTKRGP